MLRRLSPQSRMIVEQAEAFARKYQQDYIDSEHVLLAIAETSNSRAGQLLRQNGVTSENLRKTVEAVLTAHTPEYVTGRLPGTIHFRNIIARAVEIAESRQSAAVDPEHLLLALSREKDSTAIQALQSLGLDPKKIEQMLA